jgi:hypothetical protein
MNWRVHAPETTLFASLFTSYHPCCCNRWHIPRGGVSVTLTECRALMPLI